MRLLHAAILGGALAAGAAGRLRGDIVHLRDGKTIEGEVAREANGAYRIETASGAVVIKPASEVLRVEPRALPRDELRARRAKVADDDLDGLVELIVFAREKSLTAEKRALCELVLRIDPNQEMARAELGWVVFENDWILEKELRKKREELGLVKFHGEWMSVAERDRQVHEADRRELANLFRSVESENSVITDFAVRKILDYRGARAWNLFLPYLDSPHENVRLVAVTALARFPRSRASGSADEGRETARRLYTLWLEEPSERVLKGLRVCLRVFSPSETFDACLATLRGETVETEIPAERADDADSGSPEQRTSRTSRAAPPSREAVERASELAERLLLKVRVPGLIASLSSRRPDGTTQENPDVHRVLVHIFGDTDGDGRVDVDHGHDAKAWTAWWNANRDRYRDHP